MQKHFLRGLKLAAVSMLALSAQAEDASPKVKVAGNLTVNGYGANQKVRTDRTVTGGTSGEARVEATGKAHNGLDYGATGIVDLDNSSANRIKAAYITLGHQKYGDWIVGGSDSVSHLMGYDGADLMYGSQGPSGSAFEKVINVTRGVSMKNNMATKNSYATKVTYMSPVQDGFRFGLSFTPNEAHSGVVTSTNKSSTSSNTTNFSSVGSPSIYAVNALEGVLKYTHNINTGGKVADVDWFIGGRMARAKFSNTVGATQGVRPVRAMQAGVVVDYGDYQFGGGYFNNGRSFMRKQSNVRNWTNLEGFNVAFSTKLDRYPGTYVSIGHTGSSRTVTGGKARGNVTSLGLDYDVAKGLVAYVSADMFDFKSPKAHQALSASATTYDYLDNAGPNATNNKGALLTAGMKLRF